MGELILVGLGGFFGAMLRYWLSGVVQAWSKSVEFPYGTLAVNIIGSFIIGVLIFLVENRGMFNPQTRLAVLVGLLGSFTTFSTFSLETYNLLKDSNWMGAFTNILTNNGLGLLAVWFGRTSGFIFWR